jgi:hypothetical protein
MNNVLILSNSVVTLPPLHRVKKNRFQWLLKKSNRRIGKRRRDERGAGGSILDVLEK